ncbi:MAG: adenosylcobinamide-phosphate synthase CbiB [Halobacteria archaeon]
MDPLWLLAGALLWDLLLGEPPERLHPVVGMGRAGGWLAKRAPPGSEGGFGWALALGLPLGAALLGGAALLLAGRIHPAAGLLVGIFLLKSSFALRGLDRAARRVAEGLEAGDLEEARRALPALVGRDPASLDRSQAASAAVESVAENFVDSVLAPLLWFALLAPSGLGVEAALFYRAVNTLDATVGYPHMAVGRGSALLDTGLNWLPARLAGPLLTILAGDRARARRIMARDRREPPGPNRGWSVAAMAGALGVRLEKPGAYIAGEEFPPPGAGDIRRALGLFWGACAVAAAAALVAAAAA